MQRKWVELALVVGVVLVGRAAASQELGQGVRAFAGIAVAGGISLDSVPKYRPYFVEPAALFALRGGLFIGRWELALELAPATYYAPHTSHASNVYDPGTGTRLTCDLGADGACYFTAPHVSVSAGVGTFFRPFRNPNILLPLRLGAGIVAKDTYYDDVHLMVRLDGGIAYQWGNLVFEATLVPFRFITETQYHHEYAWLWGVATYYVF